MRHWDFDVKVSLMSWAQPMSEANALAEANALGRISPLSPEHLLCVERNHRLITSVINGSGDYTRAWKRYPHFWSQTQMGSGLTDRPGRDKLNLPLQ